MAKYNLYLQVHPALGLMVVQQIQFRRLHHHRHQL
jgi:hypothetical protein